MILSEVLTLPVLDAAGEQVGVVADLRFELDPATGEARLLGVLVGRRAHSVFLGYERTGVTAPAVIARFLAWRERGAVLRAGEPAGHKQRASVLPPAPAPGLKHRLVLALEAVRN